MTNKELLHQLVDRLGDDEAERARALLEDIATTLPAPGEALLPSSVGIGDSGRSDVSEKVGALLAKGFGSSILSDTR